MRALLLGVVGVVLASGAAEAKGCRIDRAIFRVVDPHSQYALNEPMRRPDLVGKSFRVSRYVDDRKPYISTRSGVQRLGGYEAYEIRGNGETFVVKREYIDGSPAVTVASADADQSRIGNINWSQNNRRKPMTAEDREEVSFGPLSSLALQLKSCR